ncbi:MAG: hypothetical protein H7301_07030 [Cryobacterium sp.]|nr:hypothetical protein [Oligoflexia bacterium]
MSETTVPKSGEFDDGRFWFSRRGNVLTIGLTNHGIDALGDLEGMDLPEEGDHFDAGDEILTIEGNLANADITLPSRGLVTAVNPATADLSSISDDPLEEGWLLKFQVEDLESLVEIAEPADSDDDADEDESESD